MQYDNSNDGQLLMQRDEDNKVRHLLRSKHIDMRNNADYNVVNGGQRVQIDLPQHRVYNPPDTLQSVGARILGTGFAGKPIRRELFDLPKPQSQQSQYYGGGASQAQSPPYNSQAP